ncbi:MAG: double zinc ribbon domain-containing protein [Anaerolineae bacterium]
MTDDNSGHVCPYCDTLNEQSAGFCRKCGVALTRRCSHCDTVNWIDDEHCAQCGAALDILEWIMRRDNLGVAGRLNEQMDEAGQIKAAETAASQARMERMLAEEREMREALRLRLIEQKEQEKKTLTIVLSVAGVLFLIMLIVALIVGL